MSYTLNLSDYQSAFAQPTLTLGQLSLPSGQLLLCDPFTAPYECPLPFLHPVPCGTFTVEAAIKRFDNGDQRLSYVRLIFADAPIGYVEMGLTMDHLHESFAEDEFAGTLSETGYLALLDSKALSALPAPNKNQLCQQYEQQLEQRLAASHVNTYRHARFVPHAKHPQHALLAFTAGWGEGLYPLFFAYTHEPQEHESLLPVCAIVPLLLD